MTEFEVEIKNKLVDYAMENGVDDLSSFEVDFIEKLDNLSDTVNLSDKEFQIMNEISNKLNL